MVKATEANQVTKLLCCRGKRAAHRFAIMSLIHSFISEKNLEILWRDDAPATFDLAKILSADINAVPKRDVSGGKGDVFLVNFRGNNYIVKRDNLQERQGLNGLFGRRSTEFYLMRKLYEAEERGIDVPAPKYFLVAVSRDKNGKLVDSFSIQEFIRGTAVGKIPDYRKKYSAACAQALATLHKIGIFHGEPRKRHFFVEDGTRKIKLIDIYGKKATARKRATDRMRFAEEFDKPRKIHDFGWFQLECTLLWKRLVHAFFPHHSHRSKARQARK